VKTVVAYIPDLMDRSKVSGAPANVTFVNRPADLADAVKANPPDLVVVDLTRPGVVDALATSPLAVAVIGFANHTNREVMDAARAAGVTQVMARSAFFGRLDDLLGD
jgi:CheY-like chemotaxis protein